MLLILDPPSPHYFWHCFSKLLVTFLLFFTPNFPLANNMTETSKINFFLTKTINLELKSKLHIKIVHFITLFFFFLLTHIHHLDPLSLTSYIPLNTKWTSNSKWNKTWTPHKLPQSLYYYSCSLNLITNNSLVSERLLVWKIFFNTGAPLWSFHISMVSD